MQTTTTQNIPNKEIEQILGIVKGSTIRSKHLGIDILAGLKTIFGGEIRGYSNLITEAREEAYKRMLDDAKKLDSDAIVNVRFETSQIMQGVSEVLCYGTAVKLKN